MPTGLHTYSTDGSLSAPLDTKIDVVMDSDVTMVGGSETGSHYSLTGVVYITFPLLPNEPYYSRLLTDVTLSFEGKSEYWDAEGRYTPMRLYYTTYRLLPQQTLVAGHMDNKNMRIALDFDISVPGWLPPTHITDRTGTGYGLVAKANVAWAPECVDFMSDYYLRPWNYWNQMVRTSLSAYTPVRVRRHRLPTTIDNMTDNQPRLRSFISERLGLEVDIRSREWYDLAPSEGIHVRVDLRATAKRSSETLPSGGTSHSVDMDTAVSVTGESKPKRSLKRLLKRDTPALHLLEMGMHVDEITVVRSTPSNTFTSSFPLPAQPTSRHELYGPSFCPAPESPQSPKIKQTRAATIRSCSLGRSGTQMSHSFNRNELPLGHSWRTVTATLSPGNDFGEPQSDMSGPFVRVTHVLKLRLAFQQANGDVETEWFAIPIRLGTSPCTTYEQSAGPPPYVTVFYENGEERDCDPLPMYTPSVSGMDRVPFMPQTGMPNLPGPSPLFMTPLTSPMDPHPVVSIAGGLPSTQCETATLEIASANTPPRGGEQVAEDQPASSSSSQVPSPSGSPSSRPNTAADLSYKSRETYEQWAAERASAPSIA